LRNRQLEKESMEVDPDSKLSKLLVGLYTLEAVVKEIVNDKGKVCFFQHFAPLMNKAERQLTSIS
jgi:hypothetical protein